MDKNTWDAITAISTAAAAVFTAVMAWFTRKAILEGQSQRQEANDHFAKTREQDKQHHEEAFRPLLVLTPSDVMDPLDRQNMLVVSNSTPVSSNSGTLIVKGAVRNIGTGPALNIRLSVHGDGKVGFGPSRELTPMSAGSMLKDQNAEVLVTATLTTGFNRQDLNNLPNGLWLLVLEYEDLFGNLLYTLHSKRRGTPWTRVGRGKPLVQPPYVSNKVVTARHEGFSDAPGFPL